MKINKKELQEALEIVKPGLSNRDLIEQTTSFAFLNQRVVTYNDILSISHPLKGLEIEGAIPAELLYKFLGKIKKDEIDISIEKNEIILKSGRAKASLTLENEVKLPLSEVAVNSKWFDLPTDFIQFLKFAIPCCSNNAITAIITCVNVTKEGFIEASDNYRILRCQLQQEMPVNTFLLPSKSALEVVKLNPVQVAEGRGWIHFKTEEDTIISCRILEEKYPLISSLLNVSGIKVTLPQCIEEVLERAMVFAKRDNIFDEAVEIELGDNKLKIQSESDSGWFEEDVNMKYDEDVLNFVISPYLLKDILVETFCCEIGKNNLKFEGDQWIYVSTLRSC